MNFLPFKKPPLQYKLGMAAIKKEKDKMPLERLFDLFSTNANRVSKTLGWDRQKMSYLVKSIDLPKYSKAESIAKALGLKSAESVLYALKQFNLGKQPTVEEIALSDNKSDITGIRDYPILGSVQAGIWKEVEDFNQDEAERFPMHNEYKLPDEKLYILNVVGTSMNKIAKDGDKILCINIEDLNEDIQDSCYYVLENIIMDKVETTFKMAKKNGAGFEFWPESYDPKHQEPIKLGKIKGSITRVKARVVGLYKNM